ncbi:MAG TPA: hypothetical protein VE954_34605, partial [Oligoflexus sp.]|uniref:hypothetical protein n=1 Tax=Oligoflexus sp. TaxID=1971216 RepID=UPI002D5A567E
LGLNLTQPLETYFERNKGALAAYGPSIEHKNYDWAINSNDRLPGWNFLQFSKPPIPGVNFGMTEREPSGKNSSDEVKTKRFALMYHPNTARTFLGALIVTADPAHRKAFEAISAARPQGDRSYLADGTFVQWVKPGSDLAKNFSDKKFPLQAFVVGVSSMEKFQAAAKPEGSIDFNRKKAAHIKLVPESWDILAVELNTAEDLLPLGP